jgi:predicted O-methyltransferase YrrM
MSAYIKPAIKGGLSDAECEALAEYAASSGAKHALEVGHYYGLSTAVLLEALPADCTLTTIDHHHGDPWSAPTSIETFRRNIAPVVGDRDFTVEYESMDVLAEHPDARYDFVFYDASHTAEAVAEFWSVAAHAFAESVLLVFDDADWPGQATMTKRALRDRFHSIRTREFYRDAELDKLAPDTFTLEAMQRSGHEDICEDTTH